MDHKHAFQVLSGHAVVAHRLQDILPELAIGRYICSGRFIEGTHGMGLNMSLLLRLNGMGNP
eukprot:5935564-Amphidinium_carterae.1